MIVETINRLDLSQRSMIPLIEPDNVEEWAVRYLWIQNRFANDSFLNNYFSNGNNKNINLRASTTNVKNDWNYHNKVFDISGLNGNLVWRVKTLNKLSNSIDIIEIWKNKYLINYYFNSEDTILPGNIVWTAASKERLSHEIYNTGFDVRHWDPLQSISKIQASLYYQMFVDKSINKENCIINTKFNSLLSS
jgi:hypothetical protein